MEHYEGSCRSTRSKNSDRKADSCLSTSSIPKIKSTVKKRPKKVLKSHFTQSFLQLSEQLLVEEAKREENIRDYLQFVRRAGQRQTIQIQLVYERRNQQISASIAHLQNSLLSCHKILLKLEQSQLRKKMKKVVGDDLRQTDQEPQGSLDLNSSQESIPDVEVDGSSSSVESSSSVDETPQFGSLDRTNCDITSLMEDINIVKNRQKSLGTECLKLKGEYLSDHKVIVDSLQEQQSRYKHLLVYMNNLQKLHQTETVNMRQAMLHIEEKVAFQFYEQAGDFWEVMRSCRSRLSVIDAQHKQQNVMEVVTEANSGQIPYSNIVNGLLPIVIILLMCLTAVYKCALHFIRTQSCIVCILFLLAAMILIWQHWSSVN